MSFGGNGQQRYGYVPPVQYPIGSNPDGGAGSHRRMSFEGGDDASMFDQSAQQGQSHGGGYSNIQQQHNAYGANATAYQPSQHSQLPPAPTTPNTYNPQQFATTTRTPSTTLPHHPAGRYSGAPTNTFSAQPTNYTPPTYDPSAYATVSSPSQQQRQQSYRGYNNYAQNPGSPVASQGGARPYVSRVYSGQPSYPNQAPLQQGGPTSPLYATGFPSPQYSETSSNPAITPPTAYNPAFTGQPSNYFNSVGAAYQSNGAISAATYPQNASQTQIPYPTQSQIPTGPVQGSPTMARPRSASRTSPSHPPPTLPPPPTGLQRHPTNAPLPNRPMEDVPEEGDWNADPRNAYSTEQMTQEDLMNDIVGELGRPSSQYQVNESMGDSQETLRRGPSVATTATSAAASESVSRYNSTASNQTGATSQTGYAWDHDQDDDDDESDQEGAAGLALMQQDEDNDRRFSGGATVFAYPSSHTMPRTPSYNLPPPAEEPLGSDSDVDGNGIDLSLYSGGHPGNLAYGQEYDAGARLPRTQSQAYSHASHRSQDAILPYPADGEDQIPTLASMDYSGTGGLQAPIDRRPSYDDGDEHVSIHSQMSGSSSPMKSEFPDMFYHPGLSSRPLPALPPGSDSSSMLSGQGPPSRTMSTQHAHSLSAESRLYPVDVYAAQDAAQQQLQVERSMSLSNHSTTPTIVVPGRSRTDAAEERRKALRAQQQQQVVAEDDSRTPSAGHYDEIVLPNAKRRKFTASKLGLNEIKRCTEPWAMSGIAAWLREMAEGDTDLKRKSLEDGLVKLFSGKVPTMNVADAETLAANVVDRLYAAGILVEEEEWVKFGQGTVSGVFWQMTGSGCYAPRVHEGEIAGDCYSHFCTRTLKRANLDNLMSEEVRRKEDWQAHYKLSKEQIDTRPKKEGLRQHNLHEILTSEEDFINQLDIVQVLYRDQLRAWQPPIISPNRLDGFTSRVFGKFAAVETVNKEHLLAQLKYRQNKEGPWVTGFSDIFREWIRKARVPYIEFSEAYPAALNAMRKENERNMLFHQFLEHVRQAKRSERLGWDTYLKAPITRLQRYTLLLSTVAHNSERDNEEKANLLKAIEEIKAVTLECNDVVARAEKKVDLANLQSNLTLRPGMQSVLNLDHLGRRLLKKGDLTRMGSKGIRWVDTTALLFDHYFILAKPVGPAVKEGSESTTDNRKFDVSKEPIPMPLLLLDSFNDEPVTRSRNLAAPLTRTTVAASSTTQLSKINSNGGRPGLETVSTSGSGQFVTKLTPSTSIDDGNTLYPFKIKHLGHETYTLYANSPQDRQEWCDKIIEAKTLHANALHAQNAEPFRLRVVADGAFAYETGSVANRNPGISIPGTPLDRAIRDMEKVYGLGRGPPPVCRAAVNCATAFTAFGKSLIAVGTDYGIFISEASNPRGWTRCANTMKVTQIAVLEEFSICLVVGDRSLIAMPLDTIAPVSNFPPPSHDNPRKQAQRLAKDVSYFATARMKDRMLIFYKRKESMHTVFKVLEPVFQRASEKRSRIFGGRKSGGTGSITESFRDYDEFYLPVECFSLSLFQTYISVATAKGFEMLTLDKKVTMSVPSGLSQPAIANIASRIQAQRPLGMFRLNDQEFLLTYEDCAVYVDKHGEVSRTLIMEYSGKQKKAKGATMFGQYLLLFNDDYVEVRNAENGRLRQIIAGRDVRCLDYGFRGPTGGSSIPANGTGENGGASGRNEAVQPKGNDSKGTVKVCMTHPEVPGTQIVLEMLLNDGHAAEKVGA